MGRTKYYEVSKSIKRTEIIQNDFKSDIHLEETGISTFNPTDYLPAKKPENLSGDFIQVDLIETEPIKIESVKDTTGRLSDILDNFAKELKSSVIPLKATDILPQVVEFARYQICEFRGQRFAFSSDLRQDVIRNYEVRIKECIESGIPFKESLWTYVSIDNIKYETLLLSPVEWSVIISKFRLYKASIFKTEDTEELLLIVGD